MNITNLTLLLISYRWDGKDRSNGYEKRYLLAINQRNVTEHENYKWRSEDM